MRERYWSFFFEIKHKSFYYKHFQALFNKINWVLSGFLSLTTLSSIAAWGIWEHYQLLWAILICFSQVVQALFPKLPYNDLLISTQFMISALDKLLIDVECDWLRIDAQNLEDDEIMSLLNQHMTQYSCLVDQFFSGTYLPTIEKCQQKAEKDCKIYFNVTYPTS